MDESLERDRILHLESENHGNKIKRREEREDEEEEELINVIQRFYESSKPSIH